MQILTKMSILWFTMHHQGYLLIWDVVHEQLYTVDVYTFRLAQFYESIVTCLCDALRQREWDNPGMETLLRGKLHSAQVNLLHTFHQIVDVTCIQPLLEMRYTSRRGQGASQLLAGLVPWHQVKSLDLIAQLGTCRFHLWVPDLQISCSDFI